MMVSCDLHKKCFGVRFLLEDFNIAYIQYILSFFTSFISDTITNTVQIQIQLKYKYSSNTNTAKIQIQ